MSRCYPFPLSGYVRNGNREEALLESIKKAEDKVKKERRKERKKEKKDKKRKERGSEEDGSKKHSHKRRHKHEDAKGNQKVLDNRRIIDNETELLEKCCLTEERDNQTASQNSCDSTINSNDRPKQSPPLDGNHSTSESVIRIPLPVKRQRDPEVLTSKDEQPDSFRGRIEASRLAPRESVDDQLCSISASVAPQHALSFDKENERNSLSNSTGHIAMRLSKEKTPSSSCSHAEQPVAGLSEEKPCSAQPSALCTLCPPNVAVQLQNLIDNWVPEPVERQLADSEDQEWWCIKSNSHNTGAERCQVSSFNSRQGISKTQWPSACYLPEADIYALPYTIPF